MKLRIDAPRILDFDIENRPLTYLGSDFTTSDITGIAASFGPRQPMWCRMLGPCAIDQILSEFVELYNQADIVTGHYIRVHDLPIINGALVEYDFPPLQPKMTIDTKLDLIRFSGISKSQESMYETLTGKNAKVHMTQAMWRAANRLEQVELAEKRVIGDVRQHMKMRAVMSEAGLLRPPRAWRP